MIVKQGGNLTTATERMESARSLTKAAVTREFCLAVILSRFWPSWLGTLQKPNPEFPFVLVLESPAGPLTYRVHRDELDAVAHIERRDTTVTPQTVIDKESKLILLMDYQP